MVMLCGTTASAVTVFDDFSDGNDTANPAWTRLDGAVASTGQTWDASSGAYHITAPGNSQVPGLENYGFAGAYTGPVYTDVRVTADIVDFPNTGFTGSYFAIAARLNGDDSLPTAENGIALHGYSYVYEASAAGGDGEMVLEVLHRDGLKDVGSEQVFLDNTKDYRFILEVVGQVMHGQVWELDGAGNQVLLVGERTRDLIANPPTFDHDDDDLTPEIPVQLVSSGYSGVFGVGHVFLSDADFTIDNFKTESLAGDFDEDGDIDALDLSDWVASFGAGGGADGDADGDSDGADFLVWQRDLSAGPAAAAVPEPAALGMTAIAWAVVAGGRLTRRGRAERGKQG
ncbi:MAG: hypothetical protein DCC67_14365 [Planctomycetota bacterium]|nr:MAG: hypothetical protein DCC67_14365 [Planctomycetota bacterium]